MIKSTTNSTKHAQTHTSVSSTQIYIYSFGALIAVCLTWSLIDRFKSRRPVAWLRKTLILRTVAQRPIGTSNISLLAALCIVLLLAVNILALRYNVNGITDLAGRSSQLSLVHLFALFFGAGSNIFLNSLLNPWLNLSIINLGIFHRWLGRICLFQAGIHAACHMILLKAHLSPSHITVSDSSSTNSSLTMISFS
jgi:hypothetical protein